MATRRGLVVWCSYIGTEDELPGTGNDAVIYEDLLRQNGFLDIRMLSDRKLGKESAQRGNIIRGIQWLVADAKPGDSFAFVFLGHGATLPSTSGDRRDQLRRTLCASEPQEAVGSSLLADIEVQALFATLPPGAMITCLMDCPYADTMLKLPWYFDAKYGCFCPPKEAVARTSRSSSSSWPYRGYWSGESADFAVRCVRLASPGQAALKLAGAMKLAVQGPLDLQPGVSAFLLCACCPDQACFECSGPEGTAQGAFTTCLRAVLQRFDRLQKAQQEEAASPTYLDVAQAVQAQLQEYLAEQGLIERGFYQDILLGFTVDPAGTKFLAQEVSVPS